MPSPQSPAKPVDLGKAIGLQNQASVQAKIKKWQTAGGGVVVEEDSVASESEKSAKSDKKSNASGRSKVSSHSKSKSESALQIVDPPKDEETPEEPKTPSQVTSKSVKQPVAEPPAPNIVEVKPQSNKLDADVREAIAPKKRIVSDGHWRRKHIDPNAKPPPPPKKPSPEKEKEQHYAWVRPPMLARPGDPPSSPPKPRPAGKDVKVYTGKLKGKSYGAQDAWIDLVAAGATHLSKRPAESRPMAMPMTPPPQKITVEYDSETESEAPTPRPRSAPKRSSRATSRPIDDAYTSPDERPRRRLTKSRPPEESIGTSKPSRRRSLSLEDHRRHSANERSWQKETMREESETERRERRRRRRRKTDEEASPVQEVVSPASLPHELNNHDEDADKRRENFRAEFATYKPPKERRSSGKKRTTHRFSYSPDGVDRIPDTMPREPIIQPPPQRQGSQRIEAWLTETPDPFRETKSEPRSRAGSSRRDFSFEKKAKSAMTESTVDTETTITISTITDSTLTESTIEPRSARGESEHERRMRRERMTPKDRRQRAQSEPSDFVDPQIEVEYSSTTSVPTLKRSGARHRGGSESKGHARSATTGSTFTDVTESDITESVVSSSIDPRSLEKPGEGGKFDIGRRLFPSTGRKLSTIVSVETLDTKALASGGAGAKAVVPASDDAAKSEEKDDKLAALPNLADGSVVSAARSRASVKRKHATHADLMTVLSMPTSRSKSIVSARSIRTHRSRLETATIEDLMKELSSDEVKYMRELRTLADGVIPILLKCVLSKSDAAIAAGLFKNTGQGEKEAIAEASKAIHDMSVAIQRLKSLHTRIPKENHFSLLIWAQSAYSVYEKYIKTWRLGFQDVVVSLATEGEGSTVSATKSAEGAWDQGMPRNEDGYIVDGDGERVDVAFLLRRPLVRLKYLTKTMKGINIKKPSEQAGVLSKKFDKLMEMARNKVDDEKARIEDEAAATIDATRARDPKSLAPISGVKVDQTRCVKARDFFDLHFDHSSGQKVDCRVELLCRDDAEGRGNSGDILICEVDETGRWLLFPPIEFKRISARTGEEQGQIVVMIRGVSSSREDWDELFTLTTPDVEVQMDWIQWLGLHPVPPLLDRKRTFKERRPTSSHASSSLLSASIGSDSTAPLKSRTPSPREIEVPIGERAGMGSKRWSRDLPSPRGDADSYVSSPTSERATLYNKKPAYSDASSYTSVSSYTESDIRTDVTPPPAEPRTSSHRRITPRNLNEAMQMAGDQSPGLKRAQAKRYRSSPSSGAKLKSPTQDPRSVASAQYQAPVKTTPKKQKSIKKSSHSGGFSVWIPNSETTSSDEDLSDEEDSQASSYLSGRPPMHHRTSSVPSLHLPSVPRVRSSSKRDNEYMSGALLPEEPVKTPSRRPREKEPTSAPPKLEKITEPTISKSAPVTPVDDKPPPPPPHRTPSSNQVKFNAAPSFAPSSQLKRRSSSPLKHEYRPSSPSTDSSYTEEDSLSEYSDESLTSEDEDDFDDDDVASTFVPSVAPAEPAKQPDLYSIPNGTIKPSESASQAPYRAVPQAVTVESKPSKCVATIFTWSDKGQWELLHPDDCSIVITPGLIGAYPMSADHQTDALPEERPLVGQELTPLVPLRRGTALDITIRSPPIPASRLRPGANVMFRSRSSEECELLYNLINRARINNPTYIALQNARPPTADGWAAAMDRRNSQRDNGGGSGWFGSGFSRSKSYRASSRAQSTAGNTESSINTISSVLTAMKRFSGSQFLMDKARSQRLSMSSRDGSDSLNSSGSGARSPPHFVPPGQAAALGGSGITNAKVRLYVLQAKNKWYDMGSSKLSILPKEEGMPIAAPLMLHTGQEKRIVVTKKKRSGGEGENLLDVTLPEPCFERWARTGIGVSVWMDVMGEGEGVAATGGVTERKVVKYMIQMKSERECAYTFSLLGKLRY